MRFKSTSSSLVRTLTLVIHCNGGLVAVHSSLTSLVLQGIFFQFLVSSQLISSCYSITNVSFFLIVFYAGSAVAVEQIFSGGRDTISLRRASLNPETIRTLMLVKQRLRLARTAIHDILRD